MLSVLKITDFPELLKEPSSDTINLLVIDGLEDREEHRRLQGHAILWTYGDKFLNKLVMICSVSARFLYQNIVEDRKCSMETYMMSSWTLEEFQEAVTDEELFYKQIEPNLDAAPKHLLPQERVSKKFTYTGGSAYLMFNVPTDQVKTILHSKIYDLIRLLLNTHDVVTRLELFKKLLNFYYDHSNEYV
jgi:hypothetical protein